MKALSERADLREPPSRLSTSYIRVSRARERVVLRNEYAGVRWARYASTLISRRIDHSEEQLITAVYTNARDVRPLIYSFCGFGQRRNCRVANRTRVTRVIQLLMHYHQVCVCVLPQCYFTAGSRDFLRLSHFYQIKTVATRLGSRNERRGRDAVSASAISRRKMAERYPPIRELVKMAEIY